MTVARPPQLDVLIVDDDFRVAVVHQGFVERVPGYRVIGLAHTAAEALELATQRHPDLVLMDVYLPDGDGLQVLRSLLDLPRPPVALVISASGDAAAIKLAIQLGAAHYLVKPFGFAALEERLTAIRDAQLRLHDWPSEPTQRDVDSLFDLLHPTGAEPEPSPSERLAPTLRLVLTTLAGHEVGLSASDVAKTVGISRATAQRYLAQLEQSRMVTLELRYGLTGRPEHLYSIRRPAR